MKKPANHSLYRVHPQCGLNFDEITVDNFAGGGGASMGIELGLGRPVDIAINHDIDAIRMHEVNHPHTRHFCESVWDIDPVEVTQGRKVGLAWFSPDCKHFSKARGGVPVKKEIRGLAWVSVRWGGLVRPRLMKLENVEEFTTWGPLVARRDSETGRVIKTDGTVAAKGEHVPINEQQLVPCPNRKGKTFRKFVASLRSIGYQVEWRELRACDYGAPTIRKRFFLIARCDGQPIVWPAPTHGKGLLPYRTAADIIDWSIPCPSIFDRKRPLADATMRRIAAGVMRYVVNAKDPFIVPAGAIPFITEHANATHQRNMPGNEPLRTICAQVKGGHFALVSAFIAKHYTGVVGHDMREPLHTITSVDHHSEVRAFLVKYYGTDQDPQMNEPLHTITTKDRFGLVMVHGEPYRIVDIGMRMLSPRELFNAQGFPADYIIGHDGHGKAFTKTAQVARCGNSVSPSLSEALVRANMGQMAQQVAA